MTPALLFALVTIGAPPCQPGVPTEWEIEYADGLVVTETSPDGELNFEERPYRDWRSRARPVGTVVWSDWSRWIPAKPYLGDVNGSCSVTSIDFNIVRIHLGEVCPP